MLIADVRFGPKADICAAKRHVRFAPNSDINCVFRELSTGRSKNDALLAAIFFPLLLGGHRVRAAEGANVLLSRGWGNASLLKCGRFGGSSSWRCFAIASPVPQVMVLIQFRQCEVCHG